ncbi:conserved hypothetical protein [Culex quinquefasciatus]|uniref:VWFC domain-containing protein n=1 Tax=Culex quinquefasciatus TaxID=7176 RepID=B0XCI2_CULQU|nr:conserved hypothetical protein [Culex quinquefasciatus]|eukprot:XP_001867354.1 conserved hypothetical protein [Culex quinquefasciatus]
MHRVVNNAYEFIEVETCCLHEGRMIDSGTEWTDPDDPCDHYKCVSGVVTRSRIKCHTPCSSPLPLKHGQCCPICLARIPMPHKRPPIDNSTD